MFTYAEVVAETNWYQQVGNEFSQVEGLWSQFENVMAKEPEKEESRESKEDTGNEPAKQ